MKNIGPYLIGIIFAGLLAWTGFFLYKKSFKKPEKFDTATPFISNVVKKAVSAGSITPRKEVAVKSSVSGVVDKIYVTAGEYVKKGQLIAKIKIIPNVVTLNNAESSLNRARITYADAEKELKRQEKLFEEKLIPEIEYNRYLVEYKRAKQELEAAANNLQLIKEGSSGKSGGASTQVKATVDGMLLDVPVKEGAFVIESNTFNEGTTIALIADMNDMIFIGKVDEADVGKIKENMNLTLRIGAITGKTFNANLEFISPKGIEVEGAIQFEIKAALKLRQDEFIRAGYSANADIVLDRRDSVLVIQESLLQFGKDSVYVEVLRSEEPQQFVKVIPQFGLSDGINIEVLSGLKKEDKIKVLLKKGANSGGTHGH